MQAWNLLFYLTDLSPNTSGNFSKSSTQLHFKMQQETLRVVTIAMICSTLTTLWKFQYFRRSMYNPVEHLWWSFYCKNSKPLSIFTKSSIVDASLGSIQTFYFFKLFFILRIWKSVISLIYFTFNSSNMLINI